MSGEQAAKAPINYEDGEIQVIDNENYIIADRMFQFGYKDDA